MAGSDPAEGRTPAAWPGVGQPARQLSVRVEVGWRTGYFSPWGKVQWERFQLWGAAKLQRSSHRRRITAPLPKEDCRVLAYSHAPPCGKGSMDPAGSGAHGAEDRPCPPSSPSQGTASRSGWEGGWRMEEEDTGAGGWSTAGPHIVAIVGGLERLFWRVRMAGSRGWSSSR